MKKQLQTKLQLTLGLICMLPFSLWAQPTISSASFPAAGDVLMISTANADSNMRVTASSPLAQTWDFSQLTTTSYREETVQAASLGLNFADFPNADIIQPLFAGLGTAYIDVSANAVTRLGGGLELLGFSFVAPYIDPHILQTAPLTIAGNRTDNFDIRFGENIDSVPFLRQLIDQATASTPLPGGISPDSLRIRINGSRRMYNEAHGTCIIYDGNYNVLRQRVEETTNLNIEVRIPSPLNPASGFWFDVTSIITGAVPVPIPTQDTTIYYDYLAEGQKQFIVRQNMDNSGRNVESVEFKGQNTVGNSRYDATAFEFSAYPNPTNQQTIRLRLPNVENENYSFVLSTITGKELSRLDQLNGGEHEVNISHLTTSGLYLGQFINSKGKVLKAEILQIIR
jgi:hypothetical protein